MDMILEDRGLKPRPGRWYQAAQVMPRSSSAMEQSQEAKDLSL